ncbi:MAG: hypothetical protein JXQ93_05335 [Flavobacteriaceae bacterium]
MMKVKTKYLIFILFGLAFTFSLFNYSKIRYWGHLNFELKLSFISLFIGLFFYVFFLFIKNKRKAFLRTALSFLTIAIVISLYLFSEYYKTYQLMKKEMEYDKIKTCDEMKTRFLKDVKNNEVKYFSFGLGRDWTLDQALKNKFNIVNYSPGCLIQSEKICYNAMVEKYVKDNFNDSISGVREELYNLPIEERINYK